MDVCLQVLKKSNKSRFDSYRVRNNVLIISAILPFGIVACTFVPDHLFRNSCIPLLNSNASVYWDGPVDRGDSL